MLKNLKEKNQNSTMNTGKNTPVILSYLPSSKMDFNETLSQLCCNNFPLPQREIRIINSEIRKLKSLKVIVNTDKRTGITFLSYLPEVKKMAATG